MKIRVIKELKLNLKKVEEYKENIARQSGNGSVITLPKSWVGAKVIAFKIKNTKRDGKEKSKEE